MTPDPAKQAWQSSVVGGGPLPTADLLAGADKFYRQIRRRNRIEYIASALVVAIFGAYVVFLPSPVVKVGAALVVLGTLIIAWQLHRRASAVPPPEGQMAETTLAHQRWQMARQRDALKSVFTWYLLPLIPGMVLMMVGRNLERGESLLSASPGEWFSRGFAVMVFAAVWLLNRFAARKLQDKIDEIDSLTGAKE